MAQGNGVHARVRSFHSNPHSHTAQGGMEPLEPRLFLSGTAYTVDSLADIVADDGQLTLREAIQAANTNAAVNEASAGSAAETDVITFDPALFDSGPATISIVDIHKAFSIQDDLTITGPGSGLLAIDGLGNSGIMNIGPDIDVSVSGMSFLNADGISGGGIYNSGALTLSDVIISDSESSAMNNTGTAFVTDCVFSSSQGGGIENSGFMEISDSLITGNSADIQAGGIDNTGTMVLTGSTVSDNIARQGGGIYNRGSLDMLRCIVSGNESAFGGGGIYNRGALTITSCTLDHNTSDAGAGIYSVRPSGSLTIYSTAIVNNIVSGMGQGIATSGSGISAYGPISLINSTVAGNTGSAGVVFENDKYPSTIHNSIIALNTIDGAVRDCYWQSFSTTPSGSFTKNSIIGIDPGFVDPQAGDYSLNSTSIAIDAGNNALAVNDDGTPLDGDAAHAARLYGAHVDIGAFEYQGAVSPLREAASTLVTTSADIADSTDGVISLREALAHAQLGRAGSEVTFADDLSGCTIALNGGALVVHDSVRISGKDNVTLDANGGGGLLLFDPDTHAQVIAVTLTGAGQEVIFNKADLSLTNVAIVDNNSTVANTIVNQGDMTLLHVTLAGNSAIETGHAPGCILNYSAMSLTNSILAMNQPASLQLSQNNSLGTYEIDRSLIDIDPGFADPSQGDYSLSDTSIAIDAGNDKLLAIDIEGQPRRYGAGVDLGAFEYQGAPGAAREASSTLVTTSEDVVDHTDGLTSLREAIAHAMISGQNQTVGFAESLGSCEIILDGRELMLYGAITLDGENRIAINADGQSRVLSTLPGSYDVLLDGVTITGGSIDPSFPGGGIFNAADLTLIGATVIGNNATGLGGGLHSAHGSLTLIGVSVLNNVGGGIFGSSSNIVICNSLIAGNSREYSGAGISVSNCELTITNSTIAANISTDEAGGIHATDPITMRSSIVAANSSFEDGEMDATVIGSHNLIGIDPGFVNAAEGDFRLTDTSIAIDRGDDAMLPTYETIEFDLGGHPRIVGATVDLGAFEFTGEIASEREAASTVVTTTDDRVDPTDGETSLREALAHAMIGDLYSSVSFSDDLADPHFMLESGPLYLHAGISINGADGVVFDANGSGRVVLAASDADITIGKVTITGGVGSYGGGILNTGNLTLLDATVTGNSAERNGGGIYSTGMLRLYGCTISDNQASMGGGLYTYADSLLADSIITRNVSSRPGAAIHMSSQANGTIVDCAITENDGDGISAGNHLRVYDTVVSANTATGIFAGIPYDGILVDGCLIAGNGGSGIAASNGSISHTIIRDNVNAGLLLGGIALVTDCTVESNGLGISISGDAEVRQTTITNNLGKGVSITGTAVISDVVISNNSGHGVNNFSHTTVINNALISDNGGYGVHNYYGTIVINHTRISDNINIGVDNTHGIVTIDDTLISDNGSHGVNNLHGTVTIDQSVIQGCKTGITNDGILTVTDATISGNESGGIDNSATLILTGGDISNNGGDGINNYDFFDMATATLSNVILSGNDGRALDNRGLMSVSNATITGTQSASAAMAIQNEGTLALSDSTIAGFLNDSSSIIYIHGGQTAMSNCTITGNVSTAETGSTLYVTSGYHEQPTVSIINSVISANYAARGAGGISAQDSEISLVNCTVTGNQSRDGVGGIVTIDAQLTIANSIVALNTGPDGSSDLEGNYAGSHNLIGIDPHFVRNAAADPNGQSEPGDLRLRPGSPAIDAGDNDLAVDVDGAALTVDIRGGARYVGDAVDIGAYEYQDLAGDANGDEVVNILDFVILKQHYGQSPATKGEGDFTDDGTIDIQDFVTLKQHYGQSFTPAPAPPAEAQAAQALAEAVVVEPRNLRTAAVAAPVLDPIGQLAWDSPLLKVVAEPLSVLDIVPTL